MKKVWRKYRYEFLTGLGIFGLALFLRVYNLNEVPIFGDEAIYIRWAQVMRAEPTLRFLPLSDGKQPLFMWSVIPFLKIISDPLIAGRVVSVLSGIGIIIGVFVLSKILFKSVKKSLIAAFIYAISPMSIFFDRLALAESMLAMFGVWVLVFCVLTVGKTRLDTAMLAGFFLGGALLTKSPALFFAILIPATLLLLRWPKKLKDKFDRASILVFLFSFTFAIAFAMYSILRLGPNFHMIAIRNKDYVYPMSHILTSPFDPLVSHLKNIFNYFWLMGPSVLTLLVIGGVYLGLKTKKKEALLLIIWGLVPIFIVAAISKTMTARYIYFTFPYLVIISVLSFSLAYSKKVTGSDTVQPDGLIRFKPVTRILIFIFTIHALFLDFQLLTNPQAANLPRSERSGYLEEWTSGYGIKEVSEYLRGQYFELGGQKIIVGTEGYFGTLPDGLQMYLNDLPKITVLGVGIDITELPRSLVESKEAGNKTFLVINDSRLKANPDELGLELVAVYPKAFRKEGTREYNTLGPRESLYLFEVSKEAVKLKR